MKIIVTGGSGFIGTNLIDDLASQGWSILNLSLHEPQNSAHASLWRKTDILDTNDLLDAFCQFQPDAVVHLAARTDCVENTTVENDYRVNTEGTSNVLAAIASNSSVKKVIITSSQFVCGPGRLPRHDEDYFPHTVYGKSKVITETLTRQANLQACWTLIRPTNIWGPWHPRYPAEFWRVAAKGFYVHPSGPPVIRCYGYVGNVAQQITKILEHPAATVNGQTFYVGDPPADIFLWANGFCLALRGKPALKVPRSLLKMAGMAGDLVGALTRKPFYISSSRYRSMVSNYVTPMEKTVQELGLGSYSLSEGIDHTVQWLRSQKIGY